MSQPISLAGLTSGLKTIEKSAKADVKLSAETRDKYLAVIKTYRTALEDCRRQMNGLEMLNNPGDMPSAKQTQQNLVVDVIGLGGAQQTLDQYLDYLDELEKTVTKVANRLIESG